MGMTQTGMTSVQLHETYAKPYIERIAELEVFAEWVKNYAARQASECRARLDVDLPWCKVVDQAEAALTKST